MPRSAATKSLSAAIVAGIVALLVAALTDSRDLAFSLGVRPQQVAVAIPPGKRACENRLTSKARFSAVRFQVGTYGRPGPLLEVELREAGGGPLGSGALAGGYADLSTQTVPIGSVPAGPHLALCFENRGRQRVALLGGPPRVAERSSVTLGREPVDAELTLDFLKEPRSMFSLLPTVFSRAALFRPGWMGAWTFWVLLVVLTAFVPLLLARALIAAEGEQHQAGR